MVETKRINLGVNLGFLVEVYQNYKDIAWPKIENFFMIDSSKENVEARIRKLYPYPNHYKFHIRKAEEEIDGMYRLGEILHM